MRPCCSSRFRRACAWIASSVSSRFFCRPWCSVITSPRHSARKRVSSCMREKRSSSSGSKCSPCSSFSLIVLCIWPSDGDLDLAQLRAHARDVVGEVHQRAPERRHLAARCASARWTARPPRSRSGRSSPRSRAAAPRALRASPAAARRARDFLRGGGHHRHARRACPSGARTPRRPEPAIGSASTMSSPRARRSSDSGEAVDALLDLLEGLRDRAVATSSCAITRASSTWASSPRRMRPAMRALPFSVCRWRCSSAAGAWSRGRRLPAAHALAHQRDDLARLVEEDRQQVAVDVVLDLALVLAGLELRRGAAGRRQRAPARSTATGAGSATTGAGTTGGAARVTGAAGASATGAGAATTGAGGATTGAGASTAGAGISATTGASSATRPGMRRCVPSPVRRDSRRPSRSASISSRSRHRAGTAARWPRIDCTIAVERIDGAARAAQAVRVELGRQVDRVLQPFLERVRDVGDAARIRWCASVLASVCAARMKSGDHRDACGRPRARTSRAPSRRRAARPRRGRSRRARARR